MDCSLPGFSCPWDSPGKNTGVGCHSLLILLHPLLLLPSIFSRIRLFSMSQLLTSGGQSIGVSVSASVLPMNIQVDFL